MEKTQSLQLLTVAPWGRFTPHTMFEKNIMSFWKYNDVFIK